MKDWTPNRWLVRFDTMQTSCFTFYFCFFLFYVGFLDLAEDRVKWKPDHSQSATIFSAIFDASMNSWQLITKPKKKRASNDFNAIIARVTQIQRSIFVQSNKQPHKPFNFYHEAYRSVKMLLLPIELFGWRNSILSSRGQNVIFIAFKFPTERKRTKSFTDFSLHSQTLWSTECRFSCPFRCQFSIIESGLLFSLFLFCYCCQLKERENEWKRMKQLPHINMIGCVQFSLVYDLFPFCSRRLSHKHDWQPNPNQKHIHFDVCYIEHWVAGK